MDSDELRRASSAERKRGDRTGHLLLTGEWGALEGRARVEGSALGGSNE